MYHVWNLFCHCPRRINISVVSVSVWNRPEGTHSEICGTGQPFYMFTNSRLRSVNRNSEQRMVKPLNVSCSFKNIICLISSDFHCLLEEAITDVKISTINLQHSRQELYIPHPSCSCDQLLLPYRYLIPCTTIKKFLHTFTPNTPHPTTSQIYKCICWVLTRENNPNNRW